MSKIQRFVRFPEAMEITGLSRPAIYELMARGKFPRQVKLSPDGSAAGWPEDELAEWQAERIAARDRR